MSKYYLVRLGKGAQFAEECRQGDFIGVDWFYDIDLSSRLGESWKSFNKEFIPIYLSTHPGAPKVKAGLACATTWMVCKGMIADDIVLCPTKGGGIMVGSICGEYYFQAGQILPHRRTVKWYQMSLEKSTMSEELQGSVSCAGTYCELTKHWEEIKKLMGGIAAPAIVSTGETVENMAEFVMEKHLEDFLVQNWKQTELGKSYDVYQEEGEIVGQQYPTDTGPIDILAISKDKKSLLVVELKKGKASDAALGQIQRYMGYVQQELAEEGQSVKGVIIAQADDIRLKRALSVAINIDFLRYKVNFKLVKD